MPGPPRKRDAERRRRNDYGTETVDVEEALGTEETVEPPEANENWQPLARELWDSFLKSGQRIFFEPSDWATLKLVCEDLSRELEPRPVQVGTDADGTPDYRTMAVPMNGAKLGAILKGLSQLMATEADRRRLSIELERKKNQDRLLEGAKIGGVVVDRRDLFKKAGKQ